MFEELFRRVRLSCLAGHMLYVTSERSPVNVGYS